MTETDSSPYFRKIAKAFLSRRGAPFVLSPKDLSLISAWQESGVPLSVVLDGIATAFEGGMKSRRATDRVLALQFCETQVARAFERYRDRKVGGTHRPGTRPDKRSAIRAEVEDFLARIPPDLVFLEDVYRDALAAVGDGSAGDEVLEALDERAERLLAAHASPDDRSAAAGELRAAAKRMTGEGFERAAAVRIVKRLRARHHIPYLAPFYY